MKGIQIQGGGRGFSHKVPAHVAGNEAARARDQDVLLLRGRHGQCVNLPTATRVGIKEVRAEYTDDRKQKIQMQGNQTRLR